MALPVAEPSVARFVPTFPTLLKPRPGRLDYAARLALVCALTVLVAEIYQTPEPALTAYVAFFLVKADRAESVLASILLLLVLTLVIGFVLLLTAFVIDAPFWRVTSIALVSFCLLFAASASKLRPLANTVALIAGYALDVIGTAHLGELAVRGLLYAWLFVGIPAAVSILVNLLLAPAPRRLAERALAERLEASAAVLCRGPGDDREFDALLAEGTAELATWLKLAGAEHSSPPADLAALRQAAVSITPLLLLVDLVRTVPLPMAILTDLADTLDDMAAILRTGRYPVEIRLPFDTEAELTPAARALLAEFGDTLAQFASPPASDATASPTEPKSGVFLPDAFINIEHVRYALKTTAAAMACYFTYSVLDWPGIHTCFITCYIVGLHTTAETVEKLALRILGCLAGAVAGYAALLFLIPDITSIGALMTVVFLGGLGAGWIAGGGPRISYAGFQAAFAFFLCTVQGSAPAFDLTTARDRVIGILFGNLVVYLISAGFWPVSIAGRVDPAITALLRQLAALASTREPSRRALAGKIEAGLGTLRQTLALARYEPRSIRPSEPWLWTRGEAVSHLGGLAAPLLIGQAPSDAGQRLEWLAASLEGSAEYAPAVSATVPSTGLDHLVDERLHGLERALAGHADA